MRTLRTWNVLIGSLGVLGGFVFTPVAAAALVSLDAGTGWLVGFVLAGGMGSLIGTDTLLTGLFGEDGDQ